MGTRIRFDVAREKQEHGDDRHDDDSLPVVTRYTPINEIHLPRIWAVTKTRTHRTLRTKLLTTRFVRSLASDVTHVQVSSSVLDILVKQD